MFRKKPSPLPASAFALARASTLASIGRTSLRRMVVGLLASGGAWLVLAAAAWAQDTVQVSSGISGRQITVQVTGFADPC
jgi:hypothetical protein